MTTLFKAAKRQSRKLRAALDGPSGAGKTFSALRLAMALKAAKMATRIAVIDTENESASLYEGESPDGEPWTFDVMCLKQFSPTQYTWAMKEAVKAGYDCIVIDSLSHAWIGEGGALDMVDQKSSGGGNSFAAWKDITPLQREMVDTIIRLPAHVIVTMRSKTEYVIVEETNKAGKTVKVPKKIGLAPVQRDGLEYEFDLYGCLDHTNQIRISKTRCSSMNGRTTDKPGPAFWQPLFDWMNGAAPVAPAFESPTPSPGEETQVQTYERLGNVIESAATLDELKAAGESLKSEVGKCNDTQQKSLRAKFTEKRTALSKSVPASPAPSADAAGGEVQPAASGNSGS